jgi:hypothetical protein
MREFGRLPAKARVQVQMERERCKPLFAPEDMRDAHCTVVYDGREVVRRESVGFDEDRVGRQ